MRRVMENLQGLTPAITQIVAQIAISGATIFYKLAASKGMSLRVLIAYRLIIAAVVVTPIALIVERKDKPRLTWLVVGQAFLGGLLGCSLFNNLYGESLVLTSATFVSAIFNIIPAITLVLALLHGSEKLKLKTVAGKAKITGICTSIGGAMVLIFYKGTDINIWSTKINILGLKYEIMETNHSLTNHIFGAVLALGFCFSLAGSLIVQAKMIKNYPRPYLVTAMSLSMGGLQSTIYALCVERDWESWKLGWNTNLLAAAYMGIIGSALVGILVNWGVKARGAVYVSIFNPLTLIIVAILASLLLDEKLHIGSVLGGVLIICGLYFCLWGMSKEMKNSSVHTIEKDSPENSHVDHNTTKDHQEKSSTWLTTKNNSAQENYDNIIRISSA